MDVKSVFLNGAI
jgi:hypothetical protein